MTDEETRQAQEAAGTAPAAETQEQPENTFTQEDVNNIVKREVAKALKKAAKQAPQPAAGDAAPGTGQQAAPPAQAAPTASAPETAAISRELLMAKAQLEAFRSGIRADVAEDAVYLALREAEKDGDEADEDAVREALKTVLKRHPDWKTDAKQKNGFRVGADGGDKGAEAGKALPKGRVIF